MTEHADESGLPGWLSVLSRQKWIVLLAVIAVPLVAFAVSRGQERRYEASATVLVNEQNLTAAALNLTSGAGSPPDRYVATQARLARVGTVADMAVKAAGLPHRSGAALLDNSSVTANATTDLLTFSVTDPIPAIAARLANSYAKQFAEYRHRLDGASLSVAIADARRKLRAVGASGRNESRLYRRLAATERNLEEFQTLQAASSSAVVVGSAGRASLVQPKTARNVILGVIVGLALGIALAFIRDALDTRVRSAGELRALLGLPLLGQVPDSRRRGADGHQLVTLSEPTGSATDAFRILHNNLEIAQLQRHVGSIVITSSGRGEGKSTTAANLAVVLAQSGRHVILVDFDLRHPSIHQLVGLGSRLGLTDAGGGVELADVLTRVDLHADGRTAGSGMLDVLTVGRPPPDPGEFLSSGFVTEALVALAERCDVLLVDAPPVLAVGDALTIATRADAIILVARLNHVDRAALAEARRVLEPCPALKLGVIATRRSTTGAIAGLLRLPSPTTWQQRRRSTRPHLGHGDAALRGEQPGGVATRDFFDEPDDNVNGEGPRGGIGAGLSENREQREQDG